MEKPIKRNEALKPLSRDHHHTLLLCWKIKTGFAKGIPAERIKVYADWFYRKYIIKHFQMEEKYLYPILGSEQALIRQATEEHVRLSQLFLINQILKTRLKKFLLNWKKHIRFEERTLFNEIQITASSVQLEKFKLIHAEEKFVDNLNDEFWLNKTNKV